jgi:hypothetical protein
MVFAEKDSPVYLAGAFEIVPAIIEGEPTVEHSFRTGAGVPTTRSQRSTLPSSSSRQ